MNASVKSYLRLAAFPLLTLGMMACATIPSYVDVQLPAYASVFFTECSSTNGALAFQFNREGTTLEAVDMEWAAQASGDWGLATYSPFGQTLFQIKFAKASQALEATGRRGDWLNDIAVSPDGFLRYKGQQLGLRPDEFPCFFAGRMPRSWLRQVVAESTDSEGLVLQVQDRFRRITIRIARHGGSTPWVWQSIVAWDVYWGFQQQSLLLEARRDASIVVSSEHIKDLECRWSPKEEE